MSHIDYERLYQDVIPSVVSVYVGVGRATGSGSGFVYDPAHVLTNHHVVGGTDRVELRFHDGQWREGRVVGTDAYTDLAVVAVEDLPETATPLPIATENPRPGRAVAALGNPMGLEGSITVGIVSGANRSMGSPNGFAIPDVVQTDAPINPGNSGGPLVSPVSAAVPASGDDPVYEVVGVNRARQGDNIGFAVSPAIVQRVVPALIGEGRYRHPYLRIRTLDVTPSVAEANDLDAPDGVLVVEVAEPDGGGLRGADRVRRVRGRELPVGGDVIVGIGDQPVHSHEELMRYLITETRPGEPVEVAVLRDAEPTTLRVTLGERPQLGDGRSDDSRRDGRDGWDGGRGEGSDGDGGGRGPRGDDPDPGGPGRDERGGERPDDDRPRSRIPVE